MIESLSLIAITVQPKAGNRRATLFLIPNEATTRRNGRPSAGGDIGKGAALTGTPQQ
ncbi:unnamed protein product [marine sediment metagenome]|uniref:Uncharacterized protein n=1 Tax=marine sediment metagenome TaxID=412755 RepID=X0YYL9_9ZZZZ